MKDVYELTNDELEDCVDGSTNISMLREILEKPGTVTLEGFVDIERFAEWFAYGVEGYIDADEGTAEYDEAWNANYEWGESIAENINDYLESKDDEE